MKRRLLAIVLAGVLVFSQNGAVLAAENFTADGTTAEVTTEEAVQSEEIEEPAEGTDDSAPEEAEEAAAQENAEDPAQEEAEEISAQPQENAEDPAPEAEEDKETVSDDADPEDASGTKEPEEVQAEPETVEETAAEEIAAEGKAPAQEIVPDAKGLDDHLLCVIPEEIDPGMKVSAETTVSPEVGWFENGDFIAVQNAEIEFVWDYDDECVRITDNGDGSYTVTRISDLGTNYSLKAKVSADGEERWSDPRNYYFENYNFWLHVDMDGLGPLYEDSTGDYTWNCYLQGYNIDEPFEFTVEAEGSEGEDATDACRIDQTQGRLYIDGAQLRQKGIDWVKVRVGAEVNGYPLSDTREIEFDVREPYVEDQFDFYDRNLLPEWDQWVSTDQRVYVENGKYPFGEHLDRWVTNVKVEDEEGEDTT